MNNIKQDIKNSILERTFDYCKYLYEEEKKRTTDLNATMQVYFAILTFTFGITFYKFEKLSVIDLKLFEISIASIITTFLFVIFPISLLLSFIFTIYVIRIRHFERLNNTEKIYIRSKIFKDEKELIESMIVDFSVATERNYFINQKKAKLLSFALMLYLIGIFAFLSLLIINNLK